VVLVEPLQTIGGLTGCDSWLCRFSKAWTPLLWFVCGHRGLICYWFLKSHLRSMCAPCKPLRYYTVFHHLLNSFSLTGNFGLCWSFYFNSWVIDWRGCYTFMPECLWIWSEFKSPIEGLNCGSNPGGDGRQSTSLPVASRAEWNFKVERTQPVHIWPLLWKFYIYLLERS